MEIVIVICLLIVIALLVKDKIVIRKRFVEKSKQDKLNPNLPDIMGQPKLTARQIQHQNIIPPDLDIEYYENIQIPQEEPDELFSNIPDFDEEEDWFEYGMANDDTGFATGVTFEELNNVGMLLQNDSIEPSLKEHAVAIVQKIQGTDLFSLLENSFEDASKKIAELLDSIHSSEADASSSTLLRDDFEGLDIVEFV